jgi:glycosyltransferase involved in cell wall biosynthesis
MSWGLRLSIVIPAFNEEVTVASVVASHHELATRIASPFEIIVCDDGSSDRTWPILNECQRTMPELHLLRNESNVGIPATMKSLYAAAAGEWIYFAPADGQVPAGALEIMWSGREGAALVVGRRMPRRDPASRIVMAQMYSALLRLLFRLPVRDIDSVKLYRANELRRTPIESASNFFEAEILIRLCHAHRVVREVQIPHQPRIAGRAGGVTMRSALRAVIDVGAFASQLYVSMLTSRRREKEITPPLAH